VESLSSLSNIVLAWLAGFSITILIEVPITFVVLHKGRWRRWHIIKASIIVNIITHPLLWVSMLNVNSHYWIRLAIYELFVVAAEAISLYLILKELRLRTALALSVFANAASIIFGTYLLLLTQML
jgi:hypothetical protein